MFIKMIDWFKSKFFLLMSFVCVIGALYLSVDNLINPPSLRPFKDGVQNHLVWDVNGICYFVRPYTANTVYLVSVADCNKK